MPKILIAGGTGFVGRHLCSHLVAKGHQLSVLTRRNVPNSEKTHYYRWDVTKGFIDAAAFENVEAIINLTGANIWEKRWTFQRKNEILLSRVDSIKCLLRYVTHYNFPINTFISSSAVGYYGTVTSNSIFDEESENGNDFLASVCKQWEDAAMQFESVGKRVIIIRQGVVLGKDGGIYKKLASLARLGINISVGNGKQYISWINMIDLVRLFDYLLENTEIKGILNAVASENITMNDFSDKLLKSLGRESILPNAPSFIIKLLFGKMSSLILKGSPISNEKIKSLGFNFMYNTLGESLSNIVHENQASYSTRKFNK